MEKETVKFFDDDEFNNIDYDEALVDSYFSVQKKPKLDNFEQPEDELVNDFVVSLRNKIRGHLPKPSGRVVFDSQDLET
jgi:hypothetical protein